MLYKLCDIAGFISWEGNWYSLPYEYVTELLPVRITENELFIYKADLSCIARHAWLRVAPSFNRSLILALREGYDTVDLLKALSHALDYGALKKR